jgi:thiol-disulfide isomerase/thioredoxin
MFRAILIVLVSFSVFAQKQDIKAKDFELRPVFNETLKGKKLSDFQGKFVLLDFWGTWCRPCLKTMPFVAKVKDQFGDTLSVFALSDESPEQQRNFLQNKLDGIDYIIDNQGEIIKHFGIDAIPQAVLIGADGYVKAISHPANFTPQVIKKLMANQKINLVQAPKDPPKSSAKNRNNAKYMVDISPYKSAEGSFVQSNFEDGTTGRRLYFSNLSIKQIYEYLYNMPNRGILKVASLQNYSDGIEASQLFCVDILVEEHHKKDLYKLGIAELHKRFKLQSKLEYILSQVKVLSVENVSQMPPIVSYDQPGTTLTDLAASLTAYNTFGMPVQHQSPYEQRFSINFEALSDNYIILTSQLQKMGISILEEARQIPQLILFE